jgi:hypothetical protein
VDRVELTALERGAQGLDHFGSVLHGRLVANVGTRRRERFLLEAEVGNALAPDDVQLCLDAFGTQPLE